MAGLPEVRARGLRSSHRPAPRVPSKPPGPVGAFGSPGLGAEARSDADFRVTELLLAIGLIAMAAVSLFRLPPFHPANHGCPVGNHEHAVRVQVSALQPAQAGDGRADRRGRPRVRRLRMGRRARAAGRPFGRDAWRGHAPFRSSAACGSAVARPDGPVADRLPRPGRRSVRLACGHCQRPEGAHLGSARGVRGDDQVRLRGTRRRNGVCSRGRCELHASRAEALADGHRVADLLCLLLHGPFQFRDRAYDGIRRGSQRSPPSSGSASRSCSSHEVFTYGTTAPRTRSSRARRPARRSSPPRVSRHPAAARRRQAGPLPADPLSAALRPALPHVRDRGADRLRGDVFIPLDEASVLAAIAGAPRARREAIGVCLLWSIVNPAHELARRRADRRAAAGRALHALASAEPDRARVPACLVDRDRRLAQAGDAGHLATWSAICAQAGFAGSSSSRRRSAASWRPRRSSSGRSTRSARVRRWRPVAALDLRGAEELRRAATT